MSNLPTLTSTTIAITGGARGIGLATARAVLEAGGRVAIGDIDAIAVQQAGEELGGRCFAVQLDVTDPMSFEHFVAAVEREQGPIGVLHNNAGIMPIGPFLEETAATAQRQMDINVLGCIIGMKAVLPGMLERGCGHVINTASVAGRAPVAGGLTYAASKAAVVSMTESARVEFGGRGISFTCLMPSFTNTELITGTSGTRLIKTVEPEDVAAAVCAVIRDPRPDVYVPRIMGPLFRAQPLLGRRLRDAVNRGLGADRAFLQIDEAQRGAYERRIAPAADATATITGPDRSSDDDTSSLM
jgi:NAD(P)-dependent dehydrogenase (short-subunit alcohol dehydrogenase family)